MQGRQEIQQKLFYQVNLEQLVPADNFYRRLSENLDLHFLYAATSGYYGSEGQESIDPVAFFKMLLVGYLNNINSDRKLIAFCSNCLDVRLFLKYDLDESLPWHSTISRTRQLYGEEVFLELFRAVLRLCVEKGMVRGRRQAVDSAFVKANASMDSLLEKEVVEDASAYVDELDEGSEFKVTTARKKLEESIDKPYYDRMHQKLTRNPAYAKQISKIRIRTVEPVLGTLVNFMNMRRINSRGMAQANKHVMMAALTYNLKKYLNFTRRKVQSGVLALEKGLKSFEKGIKRRFYKLFSTLGFQLDTLTKNPELAESLIPAY